VYASPFHYRPTSICTPASFPLSGVKYKRQPKDLTSLLRFFPLGGPSAAGFPRLRVPTLLWNFSNSKSYQIFYSAAGISPTRRSKFADITDETIPTREQHNKLTNHPHVKSNILELKTNTPKRHDQFRTRQMVKQSR